MKCLKPTLETVLLFLIMFVLIYAFLAASIRLGILDSLPFKTVTGAWWCDLPMMKREM